MDFGSKLWEVHGPKCEDVDYFDVSKRNAYRQSIEAQYIG